MVERSAQGYCPEGNHPNTAITKLRLAGAILIWSAGLLAVNILPLVFQALGIKNSLSESQLGTLGASFVLGTVLITSTSPFWVQRVHWRWLSMCGLVAASLGFLAAIWVSGFLNLLFCFATIGVGSGLIQTPAYAVIGNARDPVRAFSVALFVSTLLPAVVSLMLPYMVAEVDGGKGLLAIAAAIFFFTLPLVLTLPAKPLGFDTRTKAANATSGSLAGARPRLRDYGLATAAPIVASVAGGLFSGVIMAVYNFVGSIAVTNGIPSEMTGKLVGFGLLGALAGSLLPSVLERWIKPTLGLCLIVIFQVAISYPAMLSSSSHVFTAGFVSACLLGTTGFAYFLAMVRFVDPTHRIYIGYAAFQFGGIAAATAAAGALLTKFNPAILLSVAGACLVISWIIWLLALRLSKLFPA